MRYLKIFRVMHVINKVFVVVVACGLIACVPKRKFDDLNTKYEMEKEQRAETNKKLGEVEANLNELLTKRTEEEKRILLKEDLIIGGCIVNVYHCCITAYQIVLEWI